MEKLYDGDKQFLFVSYSHLDEEVKTIIDGLIRNKCRVWFDSGLMAGEDWKETINNKLLASNYFLFFISSNFIASEYCLKELELALSKGKTVIPFSLDGTITDELREKLGSINIKDLNGLSISEKISNVITSLMRFDEEIFDLSDNFLWKGENRKVYLDVIIQNQSGTLFDRVFKIFVKPNDSEEPLNLFTFETELGVNVNFKILKCEQLTDAYFDEGNNSPTMANVLLNFTYDYAFSDGEITALVSFFIVNPEIGEISIKIVDVKILSPKTLKYEPSKTIEDLKNETNDAGKKTITYIQEQLMPKGDVGFANPLEKAIKENDIVKVEQLFSTTSIKANVYRIPEYQRGYAWGEKEFKELWNDIIRVYKSGDVPRPHYTGMLALEEMDDESKAREGLIDKNAFYIVDGQQRITSVVIILSSIFDYLNKFGHHINNCLAMESGVYRFDYSNDRNDDSGTFFRQRIYQGVRGLPHSSYYLKNISDAKDYIDSELKSYSDQEVLRIKDIIMKKLVFNIYYASNGDGEDSFDVRITFETMNNRGKKLSRLELLKNRLMYLTTYLSAEKTHIHNYETNLRRQINICWKNIYQNLSYRDRQLSDDEYLQAHWFIFHRYNKEKDEEYFDQILKEKFSIDDSEFINKIRNKNYEQAYNEMYEYVDSLDYFSRYWRIINNPTEASDGLTPDEVIWLDRLNRIMSLKYVKPVLMTVCGEQGISSTQKVALYKVMERMIFIIRLLCYSKNVFAPLLTFARDLYKADLREKANKYNALLDACKNTEACFSRETIQTAIVRFGHDINDRYYRFYKWGGLSYFLYQYDASLQIQGSQINWVSINKDSIEHIMPQDSDRFYWNTVLSGITNEDEIRTIKNSLGNLLLLSRSENSKVGNSSFPVKKTSDVASNCYSYRFGSRAEHEVADYDYWSPHDIYDRQQKLFTFMYREWIEPAQSGITLDEYMTLLSDNGLLITDYPELNQQTKQALDQADYSDERFVRNVHIDPHKSEYDEKIYPYFVKLGCRYYADSVAFNDDSYSFTFKDGYIRSGIKKDGIKYRFTYNPSNNLLRIEENWKIAFDVTQLSDVSLKYYSAFSRLLKLEYGRDTPIIQEPTHIDYSRFNSDLSEDEFTEKVKVSPCSNLFNQLVEKIDASFDNLSKFYFDSYLVLRNKSANFVAGEIHLHSNKLVLLLRDIDTSSVQVDVVVVQGIYRTFDIVSTDDFDNAVLLLQLSNTRV